MAEGGQKLQEMKEFDVWLNSTLETFGADENIFGTYIRGILEGEDAEDEKKATLESILSDMTENDITKLAEEILEKWNSINKQEIVNSVHEDMDVKLARLMENQAIATTSRSKNCTDEQKRIKEAILSQYGQYSDEECEEAAEPGQVATVSNGLERNTNAALVTQAEREKREQSKIDSQKKKEKDKEDREKQKQMQADKKEKRKTQKGERRR